MCHSKVIAESQADRSGHVALNLTYGYGGTNNNGNVQGQTIARYLQGVSRTWVESYGYADGIDRLTSASESGREIGRRPWL
jgi:hypothetical protein